MTAQPRTIRDLMYVTGMGRAQVRAAIRAGQLPGYYIKTAPERGRYVIPAEAFTRFVRGDWTPRPTTDSQPIPFLIRKVS